MNGSTVRLARIRRGIAKLKAIVADRVQGVITDYRTLQLPDPKVYAKALGFGDAPLMSEEAAFALVDSFAPDVSEAGRGPQDSAPTGEARLAQLPGGVMSLSDEATEQGRAGIPADRVEQPAWP